MSAPYRVPMLTLDLRRLVDDELQDGERIVWLAQPRQNLYRRPAWVIVLFAIPWTAFSLFITTMIVDKESWFMALFGVPFVLVGLGMLSSPFWMGRKANRTVYAITDRRAIVYEGKAFGGISVQSYYPDRLTGMIRNQREDGSGDLIFEQFTTRQGSGHTTVRRGFVGLERVREAEEIIAGQLLQQQRNPVTSE